MAKAIKTRCAGTWTEARFFSFIRSALRRAFTRFPPNYQCRNAAKRAYVGTNKNQKWEYKCSICKEWFLGKNTQVHHIKPAGTLTSFNDLPQFTERMFCEQDGLAVVCKPCHQIETNQEREKNNEAKQPAKNTKRTRAKRNLPK
jgi:hypothetical protein